MSSSSLFFLHCLSSSLLSWISFCNSLGISTAISSSSGTLAFPRALCSAFCLPCHNPHSVHRTVSSALSFSSIFDCFWSCHPMWLQIIQIQPMISLLLHPTASSENPSHLQPLPLNSYLQSFTRVLWISSFISPLFFVCIATP